MLEGVSPVVFIYLFTVGEFSAVVLGLNKRLYGEELRPLVV